MNLDSLKPSHIPFEEDSVSIIFEFPFSNSIEVKGQYYRPKKELTWNAYEIHELGYRELSIEELCVIVDVVEK